MNDAIRVTRLPSGLVVVTETMDRVESVSLGAYVAAGTRNETEAENGASHFLEHMAFKGTERRTAAEIAEAIENVGGHINAYTAREQTAYYVKLLKEDLALGADIIGDILTHSTFAPDELERERGVILQEIGQANDTPDDIIFDRFQETAFPGQPMGRPVLGTEQGIRGMERGQLTGYMRRQYAAGNVVVAAAGALQHETVVELARKHFADLPAEMPGRFLPGAYAGTGEHEAEELMPVTLEELRKVQRGVTVEELNRARAQVKASLLMSLESTGSRCEQVARQMQVFGRVIPTEETVAKLNAVGVDDISRAAARIFRAQPTLAALGPAARVPALPKIIDRLAA
jgi:predicted Zn-dependent peptidase